MLVKHPSLYTAVSANYLYVVVQTVDVVLKVKVHKGQVDPAAPGDGDGPETLGIVGVLVRVVRGHETSSGISQVSPTT